MNTLKKTTAGCLLLCMTLTHAYLPQKISAYSASSDLPKTQTQSSHDVLENISAAEYTIKTDQKEYKDKDGRVRGIVSFSYPQFTSDFPFAEEINQQLRKKSHKYFKSDNAKNIKEFTKSSIKEGRFYEETEQYYWTTYCDVSYNKNGIVSFAMSEWWYAGGVHNRDYYGLNYDLTTGEKLTIKDVISGDAKKELLKSAKEYCGSDTSAYRTIKETKKYKFFFEEGTVHICFGSYELDHGTSWDIFTVKGRYE